jgi:uncharacterized protein YraI
MFRKLWLAGLFLILAFGAFPAGAQAGVVWSGEYFNNPNLAGAPIYTLTEYSPSHNWGWNAPAAGIPADYFSARWTSVQSLPGGTYQITVRADDGVRVSIDGVLYINEWHLATARTYSATATLNAGSHTISVEFYEAQEVAYIDYTFSQISGPPASGASATVNTGLLNVRNLPNPFTGVVISQIGFGQTYTVIGKNADASWLQLNVNGLVGWVNARYVIAYGVETVPVTDASGNPIPQQTATVTAYALNVRNIPDPIYGAVVTRVFRTQTFPVIGRNAAGTWVQLNANGIVGWVNARYVTGFALYSLPVTG